MHFTDAGNERQAERMAAPLLAGYEDKERRVPDEEDQCPNSILGGDPEVSEAGCAEFEDHDRDDVPNDTDRCEDTRPGAEVSPVGCSLRQDEDQDGVPNRADEANTPPGQFW